MDNQAANFRQWLAENAGYHNLCCAETITQKQAVSLVASYLELRATTPYNKLGALRKSDTLVKYVNVARLPLSRHVAPLLSVHPVRTKICHGTADSSALSPLWKMG
jgi:hypothetical protein